MKRPFQLVDVFSEEPFLGNPLAVVLDGEGLSDDEMQGIAAWLNLSETAFLLRPTTPEADYRVRIFTVARELPFAGHPTLGSCHAWLRAGGRPRRSDAIVQECTAGRIAIRQSGATLAFAAPPLIRTGRIEPAQRNEIIEVLRISASAIVDVEWADNGPGWIAILLDSAEAVLALEPVRSHPAPLNLGIVGPYPPGSEAAFELRALSTDQSGTLREDPVTGSLNASAAQWLLASGRARAPYTASQGGRLGRKGRIFITQDADGTVWVGGATRTLFEGVTV